MNQTIAQITTEDYRTAVIFKKYGIDFCCGGKKTLQETCKEKNISLEILKSELEESTQNLVTEHNYNDWELDYLVDHIIKTHHSYVLKKIPDIKPFLDKVAKKHGQRHTELIKVHELFYQVSQELLNHMEQEERLLFPFIKQLAESKRLRKKLMRPPFDTINDPINMMEMEHVQAGDIFKEIRDLTNNLIPPADACKSYNIVFSMLIEFETNLHLHIHLENNILFPKAIKLEEEIFN